MKKVNTDHPQCQPMLVFSLHISISTVERFTIFVLAVTHKSTHGAMVNASGSSLDVDQSNSMFQSQATTSCATANSLLMLHSVMVLTNTCLNGYTIITEVSGDSGVLSHSGDASDTGLSLSTSEIIIDSACMLAFLLHKLYLNY